MQHITPIRVFATDDHPIVTTGLASILQNESSCQLVGIAHSRTEMLQKLVKANPQVLLLDLHIPGTDFYDNIHQVKKLLPWVKILVYTSYYGPDLVKSLRKEGVAGCLLKGAPPTEIIHAIQQVVRGEVYIPKIRRTPLATIDSPVAKTQADFRKRLSLSRREQEILGLISGGLTSKIISEKLFISKHTVETHRKNILRKLDFSSSTELVKFAVQQGLVN